MKIQDGKHQLVGMVSLGEYHRFMKQIETGKSQYKQKLSYHIILQP